MASTYTLGGIELIADGEQSGTWGQTTNTNWQLMEEMVAGVVSIPLTSSTYTLTTTDGATSNGRHAVIIFTGSPGSTCVVTVSPNDMQKVYHILKNSNQTETVKQGTGTSVDITANTSAIVYCDGGGAGANTVNVTGSLSGYQPTNAKLTDIAALTPTDGNIIVGNGSTWVAESGATARTSLGLGSVATESTVPVSKGGTGQTSLTSGRLLLGNGTGAVTLLGGSATGQVPSWNGTSWSVASLPASGVNSVTASAPLSSSGGATPNISLSTPVAVTYGGTGSTSASGARSNLGLANIVDNGTYISMTRPFQTTGYGWIKGDTYFGPNAAAAPGSINNPNAIGMHVDGPGNNNGGPQLRMQTNGIIPFGVSRYDQTGPVISLAARGSQVGTITVTTSGTSYNTTSDERLKKNIKDAEESGSKIDALKVRQFDWRGTDEHQRYGVIAQEVESVYPEMVSKPSGEEDPYYVVDYSKLVPLLLKEIQALRARVAALEAA